MPSTNFSFILWDFDILGSTEIASDWQTARCLIQAQYPNTGCFNLYPLQVCREAKWLLSPTSQPKQLQNHAAHHSTKK
jgi:hypothetical protein